MNMYQSKLQEMIRMFQSFMMNSPSDNLKKFEILHGTHFDFVFSKFINIVMEKGHKEVARNLVETVCYYYTLLQTVCNKVLKSFTGIHEN